MYAFLALIATIPAQDAAVYHVNSLPGSREPGIVVEATMKTGQNPSELKLVHLKTAKEHRLTIAQTFPADRGTRFVALMPDKDWATKCYPSDEVRVLARIGDSWHEVDSVRVQYNRR